MEGVYIYRLHIYTQIVDLFTQIIMKQISLHTVLMQANENGVDFPVSFFSKKFNSHQLNYSIIDK